jgi:hypothetical protein
LELWQQITGGAELPVHYFQIRRIVDHTHRWLLHGVCGLWDSPFLGGYQTKLLLAVFSGQLKMVAVVCRSGSLGG